MRQVNPISIKNKEIERVMNYLQLTGRESKDMATWDTEHQIPLLEPVKKALKEMREAAADEAGVELGIVSGFRDYERQLAIWNAKARGERKLLDRSEKPIDFHNASQEEVLRSILVWSAIPGASRHHWGTEVDIFDAKIKSKANVNLTIEESESDFEKLYAWLDKNIHRFPFHRPYQEDLGGVAREPWHLSYSPLSRQLELEYTLDVFEQNVAESQMLLKELIQEDLEQIFKQYVANTYKA